MRKFSACVLLTGSLSAILISFVFLYFNMIGLEPAFYKAFFTDLVSFSVVPQLLVVAFLVSVVMVLKRDTLAGKLAKALLPGWLLWGILAFPLCFSSILIFPPYPKGTLTQNPCQIHFIHFTQIIIKEEIKGSQIPFRAACGSSQRVL